LWELPTTEVLLDRSGIHPCVTAAAHPAVLNFKRLLSEAVVLQIQFSLMPLTVISWENPIIEAMRSGSILQVKQLIDAGKVHPWNVFPDGSTLLYRCLVSLYDINDKRIYYDDI
jgi:hypothetical protein